MNKRKILFPLYYWNIFMIIIALLPFFSHNVKFIDFYYNSTFISSLRLFGAIPVLVLWLMCIRIWSEKDKKASRFFLLFFLIGFFTIFYFRKALKEKWI